jgi:hypothetical protein
MVPVGQGGKVVPRSAALVVDLDLLVVAVVETVSATVLVVAAAVVKLAV